MKIPLLEEEKERKGEKERERKKEVRCRTVTRGITANFSLSSLLRLLFSFR